ncbi:Uncharacterised protein [Vibrio cholerae]|nr:Uncharacterised protein [Vibrio cholerae]CSI81734.1 Uncharacterised protein [Vibrio cholerae]
MHGVFRAGQQRMPFWKCLTITKQTVSAGIRQPVKLFNLVASEL